MDRPIVDGTAVDGHAASQERIALLSLEEGIDA
jgi:hypothetical protein